MPECKVARLMEVGAGMKCNIHRWANRKTALRYGYSFTLCMPYGSKVYCFFYCNKYTEVEITVAYIETVDQRFEFYTAL